MVEKLWLDTETFSATPIKHGTYRYTHNCEVMLVTYAYDDGAARCWDRASGAPIPEDLDYYIRDTDVLIYALNAMFDRNALTHGAGLRTKRERWYDVAVQALAHSLPGGMDKLGAIFKLTDSKIDGKKFIQLFCKPLGKNRKLDRATQLTHPTEWAAFIEYAKRDVEVTRELHAKIPQWNMTPREIALYHLDQKINDRGMFVDTDLAQKAVVAVKRRQKELSATIAATTGGAVTSANQRNKLIEYILEEYGIQATDLRKSSVAYMLSNPDLPAGLTALLTNRQEASTTSTAKYSALLRSVNDDNRLRGTKQFCGAQRTGRWAGRVFQPDNLPRPTVSKKEIPAGIEAIKSGHAHLIIDDVIAMCSSAIRGAICARPGYKLVVSDLAGIEGRDQAYLAGETWKLKVFEDYDTMLYNPDGTAVLDAKGNHKRKGYDSYVMAYAQAFGVSPESVTSDQRAVGKVMELALGYEGGVGAFLVFALAFDIDLDDLANRARDTIPPNVLAEAEGLAKWLVGKKKKKLGLAKDTWVVIDSLKRMWRMAHPNIAAFWKEIEHTIRAAVSQRGVTFECRTLRIRTDGVWLRILMPSGRSLCYPGIRVADGGSIDYLGVNPFTHKWGRISSHGGKFFENICQAFARDILAYNMADIENAGYKIILTVHDEVVTEAPDEAKYNATHLSELLAANKPWTVGMPLAAAGFESYRYKKD